MRTQECGDSQATSFEVTAHVRLLRPYKAANRGNSNVMISTQGSPLSKQTLNELTFAGWLAGFTTVRHERRSNTGEISLVASADIEERQTDSYGVVRRCDVRLNSLAGRKLASGELKRPEVPEGRDPRNARLREDARNKALARGLPYYFTCNIADVVLYEIASNPGHDDREVAHTQLAPISHSSEALAYKMQMEARWIEFLDDLDDRLMAAGRTRPTVTTADVLALRNAIFAIAGEAAPRVARRLAADPTLIEQVRMEAANSFNFAAALRPGFPAKFEEEIVQILRFGAFVIAQKLVLYRVLEDAGPRRTQPFQLDPLSMQETSTDPQAVRAVLDHAFDLAIRRSGDFETAFVPEPFADILFTDPTGATETADCSVGEVWHQLATAVTDASWVAISQNIVGLLYELIVEERFRHQLGQFYTPEDVVDLLTTFAILEPEDTVLDPATGGGSFLRSSYARKRALGSTHEPSLASLWGCEITAFAAELSTVTLATADVHEPAAYPRILLKDFFELRPGMQTDLEIPGLLGRLAIPSAFDAVVGNPPYISYRRIANQQAIIDALAQADTLVFPKFSGKSDAYLWFIVHATQFLREGGRLSFVVSSGMLFSDYGIPLVRFLGKHFRIRGVVDSIVERWFPEADTNTVLLLLERETCERRRAENNIRFIRLRRPLARLLPSPDSADRRGVLEAFMASMLESSAVGDDPRFTVNVVAQGEHGGLTLSGLPDAGDLLEEVEA